MSEIAGRLAPQIGAYFLERMSGGKGKLLGGATGVKPANVVILGAGIAGSNAAAIAAGMGARHQGPRHRPARPWHESAATLAGSADPAQRPTHHRGRGGGGRRGHRRGARLGSADAGARVGGRGALHAARLGHRRPEHRPGRHASRPLGPPSHREPRPSSSTASSTTAWTTWPGWCPITSTLALTNATLPYIIALADKGWWRRPAPTRRWRTGVNVMEGKVTINEVAEATGNRLLPARVRPAHRIHVAGRHRRGERTSPAQDPALSGASARPPPRRRAGRAHHRVLLAAT